MVKYVVRLTDEERTTLTEMIGKGKAAASKIKHANVLLKLDVDGSNWSDAQAADAFTCSARTVLTIRQRFVEAGLAAALERKQREQPPRERLLDGDGEAQLVRLACSSPPEGQARWTLSLLAAGLIELQVVEGILPQTVMRTLKKSSEPARRFQCNPATRNATTTNTSAAALRTTS